MMRYILMLFGLTALLVMVIAGKRGDTSRRPPIELFPDMDRQPKLRPQTGNGSFKDGFSSQLPVEGTVARGSAWQDSPENTGKLPGPPIPGVTNWVPTIPIPVNAQLLARGRERFNISCSPCHGEAGDGKGITTKFGMTIIADLHDVATRRVPQQADGEIFNTLSYGKGLMQGYAANLSIPDRWAIVAYVRALQRSRLASLEDVPAAERGALTKPLPPTAATVKESK
jgi:mono/diheme cytochrome c family protein